MNKILNTQSRDSFLPTISQIPLAKKVALVASLALSVIAMIGYGALTVYKHWTMKPRESLQSALYSSGFNLKLRWLASKTEFLDKYLAETLSEIAAYDYKRYRNSPKTYTKDCRSIQKNLNYLFTCRNFKCNFEDLFIPFIVNITLNFFLSELEIGVVKNLITLVEDTPSSQAWFKNDFTQSCVIGNLSRGMRHQIMLEFVQLKMISPCQAMVGSMHVSSLCVSESKTFTNNYFPQDGSKSYTFCPAMLQQWSLGGNMDAMIEIIKKLKKEDVDRLDKETLFNLKMIYHENSLLDDDTSYQEKRKKFQKAIAASTDTWKDIL